MSRKLLLDKFLMLAVTMNTAEELIPTSQVKLIEKCIRETLGVDGENKAKVIIENLNKVGENFVTDVFRIIAELSDCGVAGQTRHYFFMKVLRPFPFDVGEGPTLCQTEVFAYTTVLEEFSRMETSFSIVAPDDRVSRADFVHYLKDEETGLEYFILKDLVSEGYKCGDRNKRLDMDHMKVVLRELAKIHGASFTMKALKRETYLNITKDMGEILLKMIGSMEEFMNIQVAKVESLILKESVKSKFKNIIKNTKAQQGYLTSRYAVDPYESIGHGDLWSSNIMFQYSQKGIVERATLVDWQVLRCHSPVLDIFHLLVTSFSEDIKTVANFKYLLDFYYENLSNALEKYSLRVEESYPKDVYRRQLKKFAPLSLNIGFMMLSYHMRTSDDIILPRDVMPHPELSTQMSAVSERQFASMWNFVLECFDECGFLDLE